MSRGALSGARLRARALLSEHPEAWAWGASAAAWIAMVPHMVSTTPTCHQLSFGGDVWGWFLMVGAMMLPTLVPSIRWVALRSFRRRQGRAMLELVVGYAAPWMALGIVVAAALGARSVHAPWVAPALFGGAAVWAMVPLRQRVMALAHRTPPLAPSGWRADLDCLRFGGAVGAPCLASCAPMMVACTLTGHGAAAMIGGAATGLLERRALRARPWVASAGCAALGAWYAAKALV